MKNKIQQFCEIKQADIDVENRKITVSFSSETILERYYYKTLLMHDEDSVDLSLLKDGASLLLNHDPNVILGRTENPRIEDRRGKVDIIFDEDEESEKYFQKVQKGSLKGISVGGNPVSGEDVLYIESGEFEYRDGEKISGPAKIYTYWRPHEISLTPIPADITVGVNRSDQEAGMELTEIVKGVCSSDELKSAIVSAVSEAIKQTTPTEKEVPADEGAEEQIDILQTNKDLIKRAGLVGLECKSSVTDMLLEGKTDTEISDHIIKQAMSGKGTKIKKSEDDTDDSFNLDDDAFVNGFIS